MLSTCKISRFLILLFEPKSQNSSFRGHPIRFGRSGGPLQKGYSRIRTVTETSGHGMFLFEYRYIHKFLSIKFDSF